MLSAFPYNIFNRITSQQNKKTRMSNLRKLCRNLSHFGSFDLDGPDDKKQQLIVKNVSRVLRLALWFVCHIVGYFLTGFGDKIY